MEAVAPTQYQNKQDQADPNLTLNSSEFTRCVASPATLACSCREDENKHEKTKRSDLAPIGSLYKDYFGNEMVEGFGSKSEPPWCRHRLRILAPRTLPLNRAQHTARLTLRVSRAMYVQTDVRTPFPIRPPSLM